MTGNDRLAKAKGAKQDEFYTQLTDIEKELRHYRKHFHGKTILCNCDDPFESNFFKYFALNFNRLGLKKLVATCYSGSPITGTRLPLFGDETDEERRTPYKAVVTSVHDANGNGGVGMEDVAELFKNGENTIEQLNGNGSYDSPECIRLLDEADLVVTNPPFSIFRKYIATLIDHEKKFIVVGNMNALKYKEMFPLLKDGLIWLGNKPLSGGMDMIVPDRIFDPAKVKKYSINSYGEKIVNIMGVCWFTNLDIKKRHEEMILVKKYKPESYPAYENFDAIDVARVSDIPYDYSGLMGVPITVMDKFNPEQFELVGTSTGDLGKEIGVKPNYRGRTDVFYLDEQGNPKCPYQRFFIRNLHPEQPKEA